MVEISGVTIFEANLALEISKVTTTAMTTTMKVSSITTDREWGRIVAVRGGKSSKTRIIG